MHIFKLRTFHPLNKVGNQVHRTGAIQRHKGNDFFQIGGVGLRQHFLHAAGFKLEHGGGVGIAENFVGNLVVQRNMAHIHLLACGLADEVLRHFNDGEVAQPQKVKLHQPDFFHIALVKHRHGRCVFIGLVHAAKIGNFAWRNQHAARVHPQIAG